MVWLVTSSILSFFLKPLKLTLLSYTWLCYSSLKILELVFTKFYCATVVGLERRDMFYFILSLECCIDRPVTLFLKSKVEDGGLMLLLWMEKPWSLLFSFESEFSLNRA